MAGVCQVPEVSGEIARTDEDTIYSFNRRDCLDFTQGMACFNLYKHANLFMCSTVVLPMHLRISTPFLYSMLSAMPALQARRAQMRGTSGC